MMGTNNPDLQKSLDGVFECVHFDWLPYGEKSYRLQQDLLEKYDIFKPDIVFMHIQSGDAVYIPTATKMAESSVVVSWTGDVRHPLPQHYLDMGRHIHSTLFTNMDDVHFCRANGVNADFLQVGFDSTYFNPLGAVSPTYPEIIFMGSNYPANTFPLTELRMHTVLHLKSTFGNNFGLYGGGWNGLEGGNITSYEEEGKAYRSCKIAINLSHFAYKRYSSDRMFRILGSGAFCLTHHFPDIEVDFKVGEEVVVWDNIFDLSDKIKYYLANDAERNRIALNGCFNARTNFTWNHFANNLNDLTEKIKNNKNIYI